MKLTDIKNYTIEQLLEIDYFQSDPEFNAITIVPTGELHDSGFPCMKFILEKDGEIVGCVGGGSDVMHINGIGGYGGIDDYKEVLRTNMVKRVGWSIDCLPVSKCARLFNTDVYCERDPFIGSDFQFYTKRYRVRKNESE